MFHHYQARKFRGPRRRLSTSVIVVAHADDESIFAWSVLANSRRGERPEVVAVTFSTFRRWLVFRLVGLLYGAKFRCLWLADDGRGFCLEDSLMLRAFFRMRSSSIEFLYTHNLKGEYGHLQHQELSQVALTHVGLERIYFFDYDSDEPTQIMRSRPFLARLSQMFYASTVNKTDRSSLHSHYRHALEPVAATKWLSGRELL